MTPTHTDLNRKIIPQITRGMMIAALDHDAPLIDNTDGQSTPYDDASTHELLHAAYGARVVDQLIYAGATSYRAQATDFIGCLDYEVLADPVGYQYVYPDAENWEDVGAELMRHHLFIDELFTDEVVLPTRNPDLYVSVLEKDVLTITTPMLGSFPIPSDILDRLRHPSTTA